MQIIFTEFSKYIISLFAALYAFSCFNVFRYKSESERQFIYFRQNLYMIVVYSVSFVVMLLKYNEVKYLYLYLASLTFLVAVIFIYNIIYKNANRLILNNMCMLLSIGFIILTRLSFDKAVRQFFIAAVSMVVTALIPFIISRGPFFSRFSFLYACIGIASLLVVLLFSVTTFGAKISFKVFGISFQPSEFVKIIFIFAIAGFFAKSRDFKQVVIASVIAAVHILILVFSKDLGGAVIFFIVYLSILYVATGKFIYFGLGLSGGGLAAFIGYKLFPHVRVRVKAFSDPFGTISNAGYQIAQSLFAIGTGGFFGMGLASGAPEKIPVVAADFIYSAISEEFGTFFGICLILICVSCLVMFLNVAMRFSNLFYKYVAVGLAALYGFQVFLTIGGVTKFIPLTGVTLPLVSYGGTSVLVTLVMFAIIQGLYISSRNGLDKYGNS